MGKALLRVAIKEFVCLLVAKRPSNMLVYLTDGSAQTIVHAATLTRWRPSSVLLKMRVYILVVEVDGMLARRLLLLVFCSYFFFSNTVSLRISCLFIIHDLHSDLL